MQEISAPVQMFDTECTTFEFSLAEFPFCFFSKLSPQQMAQMAREAKYIIYRDTIKGKGDKPIPRTWTVRPAQKIVEENGELIPLGFGGPTTLGTIFELLQLWKEQKYGNIIEFGSLKYLLERKGKKKNGTYYAWVKYDLEVLSNMVFKADNAYWDNRSKKYRNLDTSHILDTVFSEKKSPKSKKTMPVAVKPGGVLTTARDLDNFFNMDITREQFHSFTPFQQRMVPYFEKVRRSQKVHQKDLSVFCSLMGLSQNELSSAKQYIEKSCLDLFQNKGYMNIGLPKIEKKAIGRWSIMWHMKRPSWWEKKNELDKETKAKIDCLVNEILLELGDLHSKGWYYKISMVCYREFNEPDLVHRALANVRAESRMSGKVVSKGAVFTTEIKRLFEERGIVLTAAQEADDSEEKNPQEERHSDRRKSQIDHIDIKKYSFS